MSYTPERTGYSGMKGNESIVNWDRIIHKNVRTSDNVAHGKIIAIPDNTDTVIITSQGSRGEYEIPRSAVTGFNGAEVMLNLDSDQLKSHKVRRTEAYEAEHEVIEGRKTQPQDETTVPVIEERLNVQKKNVQDEAAIVKEPVTETRTVEVPVTHEELRIERRPATGTTKDRPVQPATEFSVPVSREEIEVRKQPYVKEEVVVKKEPVTETKTVNETLTSERVRLDNE